MPPCNHAPPGQNRWLAIGLAAALAFACARVVPFDESAYRGVVIDPPWPKVDFTLTDTEGQPFHFQQATDGFAALLFFGYTYCPDVCPVHMAAIGSALAKMRPSEAAKIKVVFITVDPERDTPERLAEWLGNFHHRFIGLRGDPATIDSILGGFGLPPATNDTPERENYLMAHFGAVIAFTGDDLAHLLYPFGMRQADWAHDLPLIAASAR